MAVNTSYYGLESSWYSRNFGTGYDEYKTPAVVTGNNKYTGTFSCIVQQDKETRFHSSIDSTIAWCATDSDSPFANTLYCTGYGNIADRYNRLFFNQIPLSQPVCITSSYDVITDVRTYYGRYISDSANKNYLMNLSPSDDVVNPSTVTQQNIQLSTIAGGNSTPFVKFNFNRYIVIPFIGIRRLADNKTIADIENATTYSDVESCFVSIQNGLGNVHTAMLDIGAFEKFMTDNPTLADKILIRAIVGVVCQFKVDEVTGGFTGWTGGNDDLPLIPKTLNHQLNVSYDGWTGTDKTVLYNTSFDSSLITSYGYNRVSSFTVRNNTLTEAISSTGPYGTNTCFTIAGDMGFISSKYSNLEGNYWNICPVVSDTSKFSYKKCEATSSTGSSNANKVYVYAPISNFTDINGVIEYAKRSTAYLGMYFRDTWNTDGLNSELIDIHTYLGIIDDSGITHGDYSQGADNANQKQADWGDNVFNKTPYNPNAPKPKPIAPTGEKPSDPLHLRTNAHIGFGLGFNRYSIMPNDLFSLHQWIHDITNYNTAKNAFATRYATVATSSFTEGVKVFERTFPDTNAWLAYVYELTGNGVHPNNNIVGLMAFPFEITGNRTNFIMGGTTTTSLVTIPVTTLNGEETSSVDVNIEIPCHSAEGRLLSGDGFVELNLGSKWIDRKYGDFRDYKPYTQLQLQIPYFGTVDLDPENWIGRLCTVKCIVELVTGSAMAIICRNNEDSSQADVPVMTVSGQMGFSIPLNVETYGGTSASLMASSFALQNMNVQHRVNTINGLIEVGKSTATLIGAGAFTVATGGLGAGATALAGANLVQTSANVYGQYQTEKNNIKSAEYQMEHQQTGSMIHGSSTPSCNGKYETRCRLVRKYNVMLTGTNESAVGETVGYACNKTDVLNNFKGYSVFSNVKLNGISATDEEKKLIESLLQNGVYLPKE